MRKIIAVAAVLLWTLAALPQKFDAAAEQELVRRANEERVQRGLPELQADSHLTESARRHAERLAEHGSLSHHFPGEPELRSRVAETGLRFNAVGENVAYDGDGSDAVHRDLMHSPPHRANILGQAYTAIGVGAVWKDGVLYVAQNFAQVLPQMSSEEMERSIMRQLGRGGLVSRYQPKLRQLACDMAHSGQLDPKRLVRAYPDTRKAFTFTIDDPSKLPPDLAAMKTSPLSYYSLGACFVRTEHSPQGMFWVAAIFY